MDNVSMYEVKYKLKTPKGWKVYKCNVISYGLDFINREFINRFGYKNFEILDSSVLGKVDLFDGNVIDDILTKYSNILVDKTNFKKQEQDMIKQDMEKRMEKAENDFWSIDEIINDGNMKKKHFNVWKNDNYK